MKKRFWAFLAPVFALVSVACGGNGPPPVLGPAECNNAACGGDITGTWNISAVCLSQSVLMTELATGLMGAGCAGETVSDKTSVPATGSLAFYPDLSYVIDLTLSVSLVMNVPTSCFAPATCADIDAVYMRSVMGNQNIQSASCTGTDTCVCTLTEVAMRVSETGTYTVSSSTKQVTQTPTNQAVYSNAYCVRGSTLTYRDAITDPNNPVIALVATKAP